MWLSDPTVAIRKLLGWSVGRTSTAWNAEHDKEHWSTRSTLVTFHTFKVLSIEPERSHFGGSSKFSPGEKCKVLIVLGKKKKLRVLNDISDFKNIFETNKLTQCDRHIRKSVQPNRCCKGECYLLKWLRLRVVCYRSKWRSCNNSCCWPCQSFLRNSWRNHFLFLDLGKRSSRTAELQYPKLKEERYLNNRKNKRLIAF